MLPFTLEIDQAKYAELQKTLKYIPNGARIAASHALNRTAITGKKLLAEIIGAHMTARTSSVKKRILIFKATRTNLEARLSLRGNRGVSLYAFGAKQTPAGVTATIFGQEKDFPHAFIATGLSSNLLVFERYGTKRIMQAGHYKGKLRQPIHAQYGPTVVEVYEQTPGLADQALKNIQEVLDKNLKSQVDYLLSRGGKGEPEEESDA